MNVLLNIEVNDDGSIVVTDEKGKPADAAKPDDFAKLSNKEILHAEQITVLVSNPCAWVRVGNRWYWRCW